MSFPFFLFFIAHIIILEAAERECGLPKNLSSLPDFAREEIREIWKNYVPGTPCQKELEIETDIMGVIKSFETERSPNHSSKTEEVRGGEEITGSVDYDHIGKNGGTPIPLLSASTFPSAEKKHRSTSEEGTDDYLDQTTFDDVAMMQFDTVQAPFLRTASPYVRGEFQKIWDNKNIPSESLRSLKIQILAVSLLTSKQLSEYNRWATKRRRVLKAREQEMRNLSFEAKQALRKLSVQRDSNHEQFVVPIEVKNELTTFAQRLNRRRNLKLLH